MTYWQHLNTHEPYNMKDPFGSSMAESTIRVLRGIQPHQGKVVHPRKSFAGGVALRRAWPDDNGVVSLEHLDQVERASRDPREPKASSVMSQRHPSQHIVGSA